MDHRRVDLRETFTRNETEKFIDRDGKKKMKYFWLNEGVERGLGDTYRSLGWKLSTRRGGEKSGVILGTIGKQITVIFSRELIRSCSLFTNSPRHRSTTCRSLSIHRSIGPPGLAPSREPSTTSTYLIWRGAFNQTILQTATRSPETDRRQLKNRPFQRFNALSPFDGSTVQCSSIRSWIPSKRGACVVINTEVVIFLIWILKESYYVFFYLRFIKKMYIYFILRL